MGKAKSYLIFIGLLIVVFLIIQAIRPELINWQPTYSKIHKWPYGNYALFRLLDNIFPEQPITYSRQSPYIILPEHDTGYNYILITEYFAPEETESQAFFDFIRRGNNLFVAANNINYHIYEETGIESNEDYNYNPLADSAETVILNFKDPQLKSKEGYSFRRNQVSYYWTLDSAHYNSELSILGINANNQPNFICIDIGAGHLFMHANPKAFTNYNMIYDTLNNEYVSKALSYLPVQPVIWDEYYNMGSEGAQTEIRYILSSSSLKTAWFILLFGILLYMLFESKRQQRIIPIIIPPFNSTLEFTHTIGRLYFQQKNHSNLARKKVIYFLESIRRRYNMDTREINNEFAQVLSERSGVDEQTIQQLITHLLRIQSGQPSSEKDLLSLSQIIDIFNIKTNA